MEIYLEFSIVNFHYKESSFLKITDLYELPLILHEAFFQYIVMHQQIVYGYKERSRERLVIAFSSIGTGKLFSFNYKKKGKITLVTYDLI